jgi:hypothetical protein
VVTPHQDHHRRNENFHWEVSTLWRWADRLYELWQRYRGRLTTPDIPPSHTTDTLGVEIDDDGYVIKQIASPSPADWGIGRTPPLLRFLAHLWIYKQIFFRSPLLEFEY